MFKKFNMAELRDMAVGETRIFSPDSKGSGGNVHLAAKRAGGAVTAGRVIIVCADVKSSEGYQVTLTKALNTPKPRGRKPKA